MKRKTIITAVVILLLGGIGTIKAFTALEKEKPQEICGIVVDKQLIRPLCCVIPMGGFENKGK